MNIKIKIKVNFDQYKAVKLTFENLPTCPKVCRLMKSPATKAKTAQFISLERSKAQLLAIYCCDRIAILSLLSKFHFMKIIGTCQK